MSDAISGSKASPEARSGLRPSGYDPGELLSLAARVEAAEGPDRRIDCEIEVIRQRPMWPDAAVIKLGRGWSAAAIRGDKGRGWKRYGMFFQTRDYTRSLDHALALVPGKDWEWSLEWESGSLLYHPDLEQYARAKIGDPMLRMEAECATPALAVCAAALRAIAMSAYGQDARQLGSEGPPARAEGIAQPIDNRRMG